MKAAPAGSYEAYQAAYRACAAGTGSAEVMTELITDAVAARISVAEQAAARRRREAREEQQQQQQQQQRSLQLQEREIREIQVLIGELCPKAQQGC